MLIETVQKCLSLHLSASSACSSSGFFPGWNKRLSNTLNASSALCSGGVSNHSFSNISPQLNHLLRQSDFGLLGNGSHNRKPQSGKNVIHIERPRHFFLRLHFFLNIWSHDVFAFVNTKKCINNTKSLAIYQKHLASHWITGQPIILHFLQFHFRCFSLFGHHWVT